jgi:hypothetical protein
MSILYFGISLVFVPSALTCVKYEVAALMSGNPLTPVSNPAIYIV